MAKVGEKIDGAEPGWSNISFGNSSITYTGMTKGVSYAYGSGSTASYSFTFTGTAVRIITGLFSDGATNAQIKIDNTVEYVYLKGTSGDPDIVYEKTKLPYGTHTITVRANGSGTLSLMAIHYATFANQEDKLDKPELGWQRHKFNEKLNDGTEAIKLYPNDLWVIGYKDAFIYDTSKDGNGYIRFKFYGSAIRVISTHFSNSPTNAKITIDGAVAYYNARGSSDGDRLSYEKNDLSLGIHTVSIESNGSGSLSLSAIDLKDGEYLVPLITVGDVLTQPEPGWKRFDDSHNSIKYEGAWLIDTGNQSHNSTLHYKEKGISTGPAAIKFSFYGSKLRILGLSYYYYDTDAKIIIDGHEETINFNLTGSKSIYQCLLYEKKGLSLGNHTVQIQGIFMNLDAIDVDADGYLLAKVGDVLKEPQPGWKRFDDTDSNIEYVGNTWQSETSTSLGYYKNTLHYKHSNFGSEAIKIQFGFIGSCLRIIALSMSSYDRYATIKIDDKPYNLSYYNKEPTKQCLIFEELNLEYGSHTVSIEGLYLNLDAIDIDADGSLFTPAKVGDVLTQPEPGWQRFDDSHSSIMYAGVWGIDKGLKNYNSTLHYKEKGTNTGPASIKFSFYGSKLRIIGLSYIYYDTNAKIIIDGHEETINFNLSGTNGIYQCLLYEKKGLLLGNHTVQIQGVYMTLDAIDIDADGYLFTPAKIDDVLKEPQPGWKRFDDTNPLITYTGTSWETASGAGAGDTYNKTMTYRVPQYVDKTEGTVEFSFKGTGIRIISTTYTASAWGQVNIQIDELSESYKQERPVSTYQVLLYEKTNLPPGTHTVRLTGRQFSIDAFDILDGELIAVTKIGDVLKEPESGWKRFDDMDPNILYQGNWNKIENHPKHYLGTFHNKPSSSGDDSIIKALLDFSGTKIRIIAFMSTGAYDVGTIKIDGEAFNFNYINGTPTAQCLVFEKSGLEPGIHKVELSGRYINLDAIDIDETGELIPVEMKKPKVSLYEKESGKVFVDDFDSINPKWLMSPFTAFNNVAKQGFLRMNHSADKDALLLIDKPQGNVAIQVIADYTPTKEGDKGGLLIYKNEANNIEFLESMKVSDSPEPKEWMAVCKENQWDFYNKTDITFDYVRSEQLDAHKIGVVLKKGNTEGFTPLDINKIIITTSNLLRLRQLYEKYKVVLKDAAENVISTSFVESANTGIDIPLPSLEFEGIIEIYDEDGTLVAKRQTTFFGGDMYCMGSSLHISMDTKELDETDPTHLGYMTETERLVKMTLTNDNVGPVSNVKVAIQQYMEKFGYTWAHLSLDGSHYTNELAIETLNAGSSKDFWVKIIKDVNYMAFEPIYFNIHLSHE
ncbi:protein containing cell adhesion domain protein [Bacillus cereus group sp. TH160LC]|uniref:protein containing cell adhesion domain protein n=1 Tax=Bacillus cereus group sp. TH160LC TaxID=3018058 RepID=UPI0022E3FF66|nr:protein containing cell adhesion domain protein [Bacillus cereus group sp. TH160LC]MDA1650410.1 protein containing cell adhesion domain protein [Bacillus cereus group sp. TH160LC]